MLIVKTNSRNCWAAAWETGKDDSSRVETGRADTNSEKCNMCVVEVLRKLLCHRSREGR